MTFSFQVANGDLVQTGSQLAIVYGTDKLNVEENVRILDGISDILDGYRWDSDKYSLWCKDGPEGIAFCLPQDGFHFAHSQEYWLHEYPNEDYLNDCRWGHRLRDSLLDLEDMVPERLPVPDGGLGEGAADHLHGEGPQPDVRSEEEDMASAPSLDTASVLVWWAASGLENGLVLHQKLRKDPQSQRRGAMS
jgi:hypothetical protein